MGTNLNMDSCGNDPAGKVGLARQSSIYSLTFEQLQGSVGKEFGSMNMDELLKSIWSAEEIQSMPSSGPLQRQGSLTLPRTLSAKTVDEVWKDIAKEDGGGGGGGGSNQPQKQQTLGEMTLEEFLLRAGVVKEDVQSGGAFGDSINTNGLGFGFQQMGSNQISLHSPNLLLSVNGVRSNQQQIQQAQAQMQQQQQQQQLFAQVPLSSGGTQLASPGLRIMGFGAGATNSPGNQLSSDGIGRINGDTSSVSPVPYVVNGGVRGRRCNGTVEKVVERRQKRMIKNRESAARSRARKQAYTMELEAEVAKLKEENEELRKKQEKILEMQKNQVVEMMNTQPGGKKQCLRRTQSGQW